MSRFLRQEAPLIAAAIFLAFVVWLIAAQGGRESISFTIPITLTQIPDNMDVQVSLPTTPELDLSLQYPKEMRSRIVEKNFSIIVPVSGIVSGDVSKWASATDKKTIPYKLSVANVEMRNMEPGVQTIGISPDAITLTAALRTLDLAIETPTTGELPSQFELTGPPSPQPDKIYVTGSQDALDALAEKGRKIQCPPIDLSTISASGQIARDLTLPPDSKVQFVNPRDAHISVNIGLQERSIVRTYQGITIVLPPPLTPTLRARITPPVVDVLIEGPPSALNRILPDSFVFATSKALEERTGAPQQVGLEVSFRARIPLDLTRQLKITEVKPPRISVEFVPLNAQNADTGSTATTTTEQQ